MRTHVVGVRVPYHAMELLEALAGQANVPIGKWLLAKALRLLYEDYHYRGQEDMAIYVYRLMEKERLHDIINATPKRNLEPSRSA